MKEETMVSMRFVKLAFGLTAFLFALIGILIFPVCAFSQTIADGPVIQKADGVRVVTPVDSITAETKVKFYAYGDAEAKSSLSIYVDGVKIASKIPNGCVLPVYPTGPTITETTSGVVWTFGTGGRTLRNKVWVGNGSGTVYMLVDGNRPFVQAADTWYEWSNNQWVAMGTTPPAPPVPKNLNCTITLPDAVRTILNDVDGRHSVEVTFETDTDESRISDTVWFHTTHGCGYVPPNQTEMQVRPINYVMQGGNPISTIATREAQLKSWGWTVSWSVLNVNQVLITAKCVGYPQL